MVQFINIPAPRSALLREQIGHSIGQGLANFANTYYANKALDKIINDPSLKKAPVSERLEKLNTALAPFGELGEGLLQKRLGIEQQKMHEQQQKIQQKKNLIANKLFSGQQLEPDEESVLEPSERVNIEKARAMQARAAQPKAAPGGLTGQAVPPEVSQAIGQVLKQAQEMNLDANQLSQAFDQAGIPPIYSNKYVENLRQATTKPTYEPTEERLEAERQSKLADEITKDYQGAKSADERLKPMIALAKSGQLTSPVLVKALGFLGLPLGVLQNPGTEAYQKLENDFVKDLSNYFPGQIRVYEAQTYMKTIPSLLNSDKGKQLVAENLVLQNEGKKIRYNAYKDILKENKGKKPRNMDLLLEEKTGPDLARIGNKIQDNIQNALENYGPKTTMYDPEGNRYEIPQNQLQNALKDGLKF